MSERFALLLTRAMWVGVLPAVLSCSDATSSPSPAVEPGVPASKVTLVTVITNVQAIRVGRTVQATAAAYDQYGSLLPTKTPTWSVEGDAGVGTIDQHGLLKTKSTGTVRVVATFEGVAGEGPVVVSPPPSAAFVRVSLDSTTLLVGRTTKAHFAVLDSTGSETTAPKVVWSIVGGSGVATINAQGLITAVAPGNVRVVATAGGVSGEEALAVVGPSSALAARVIVTLPATTAIVGSTMQAQAVATDASGVPLAGKAVNWAVVGSAGIATVDATGLVTAVALGTVKISARVDSITSVASLSVVSQPAATVLKVEVRLDSAAIAIGSSTRARFIALDGAEHALPGKTASWSITQGSSIATISASGLVTGVATGRAQVTARVDGIAGSATFDVVDPATAALSVKLPVGLRDSLRFVYPVQTGRKWTVHRGDNLQTVLNNAQRGDEIVLDAGATFTGSFTLPAKVGSASNGWILIRSSRAAQLPPRGKRVGPAHAPLMAKIQTTGAQAAIQTGPRSSGWWLSGLEITIAPSAAVNYGIVLLGDGSSVQDSRAIIPSDLVLDRVYIHASRSQSTSRCVGLNSARTEIDDSYLYDCHGKGFDTQAIGGWNGPGPYRIHNNMLAGAGENLMFGGADPAVPGLIPSDIEIRKNYLYTPPAWKNVWTKKNIFELKNARRVVVEGNVMDGSWVDGQVGFAVMLYSTNQSGGCMWCRVTDVTMRGNLIRNVTSGVNISARQTPVDTVTSRIAMIGNVIDGLKHVGDARLVQVLSNGKDLTIDSLVAVGGGGHVNQFLVLDPNPAWTNFRFTNSVVEAGTYGLFSSTYPMGEASLSVIAGTTLYRNVKIIGAKRSGYPKSSFVGSEGQSPMAASIRSAVSAATAGVAIP